MKIYGIGDLHFGTMVNKPMDYFGEHWNNHTEKIIGEWKKAVRPEDIVLLPGDISWAMRLGQAKNDLDLIADLPGTKICIRGNHDYWWQKITHLNSLYESIYFLQNKSYVIEKTGICGTRGWICPGHKNFTEEDLKIYMREATRLKLSLDNAIAKGANNIIVMLHYPPTNENHEPSLFTELIEEYPVKHVVYGHLHDKVSHDLAMQGIVNGTKYHLIAADYINFRLKMIEEYYT